MPGQTQSEIRALLAAAGLAPQHRFGQNFLVDLNLLRKVVEAADLRTTDTVLEVGPGTGSLTELLLASGARVVVAEIDRGFAELLRRRLGDNPRFTLVEGDALVGKHCLNPALTAALTAVLPPSGGVVKLVANLPYQIATPLLVDLLLHAVRFERLVCTIQKEVGARLQAAPRTAAYGPVSILVQLLAEVQTLAWLPASAFWPRPQVESVLLRIQPRTGPAEADCRDPAFREFVQRAFQQRRKKLRRLVPPERITESAALFEAAGVSPEARPEELPPDRWPVLWRVLRV